jgi:hypothetical protein
MYSPTPVMKTFSSKRKFPARYLYFDCGHAIVVPCRSASDCARWSEAEQIPVFPTGERTIIRGAISSWLVENNIEWQ